MNTCTTQKIDETDKLILRIVLEKPIRQIELSRKLGLGLYASRWRSMKLASNGLLRIERTPTNVTIYPTDATEAAL